MSVFLVLLGVVMQMINVQLFWNWFVVPLGVPPLVFPQAAAFVLLTGMLGSKLATAVTVGAYQALIYLFVQCIILRMGYGLSMFM